MGDFYLYYESDLTKGIRVECDILQVLCEKFKALMAKDLVEDMHEEATHH